MVEPVVLLERLQSGNLELPNFCCYLTWNLTQELL